jgi:hypothetical protein
MGMEQQSTTIRFGWLSVGLWVGLTLVGFLLTMVLHFPGSSGPGIFSPSNVDLSGAALGFVFGAISGLIIAALQQIVLKPWIPTPRAWLTFNAVGYGLVHAIYDGVPFQYQLAVAAIIVALAQYSALRSLLSYAFLWIPIATIAWFLGFQLGFAIFAGDDPANLITAGLTVGVVTSLALRRLLSPVQQLHPTQNTLPENRPVLNWVPKVILWIVATAIILLMAGLLGGLNPFG